MVVTSKLHGNMSDSLICLCIQYGPSTRGILAALPKRKTRRVNLYFYTLTNIANIGVGWHPAHSLITKAVASAAEPPPLPRIRESERESEEPPPPTTNPPNPPQPLPPTSPPPPHAPSAWAPPGSAADPAPRAPRPPGATAAPRWRNGNGHRARAARVEGPGGFRGVGAPLGSCWDGCFFSVIYRHNIYIYIYKYTSCCFSCFELEVRSCAQGRKMLPVSHKTSF